MSGPRKTCLKRIFHEVRRSAGLDFQKDGALYNEIKGCLLRLEGALTRPIPSEFMQLASQIESTYFRHFPAEEGKQTNLERLSRLLDLLERPELEPSAALVCSGPPTRETELCAVKTNLGTWRFITGKPGNYRDLVDGFLLLPVALAGIVQHAHIILPTNNAPLRWVEQSESQSSATTTVGTFHILKIITGNWLACYATPSKPTKLVGTAPSRREAAALCENWSES